MFAWLLCCSSLLHFYDILQQQLQRFIVLTGSSWQRVRTFWVRLLHILHVVLYQQRHQQAGLNLVLYRARTVRRSDSLLSYASSTTSTVLS